MSRTCTASFVAASLLISCIAGFAGTPVLERENVHTSALTVEVLQRSDDGFLLRLTFDPPEFGPAEGSDTLQIATFSEGGQQLEPGQPATPLIGRLFRLPSTGGATVEILDAEYETRSDVAYASCTQELDELSYGPLSGAEDAWLPSAPATVGAPARFHDFRVATLTTQPVQVNPARNEVRVYRQLDVAVRFNGNDFRNSIPAQPTRISRTFLSFYRDFLDWDDSELDEFEYYQGNVQVVLNNSDVQLEAFQNWSEWKREKGWDLELLTPDDVPTWGHEAIRAELIERYENAEEPFDFVVIFGDDQGVFSVPPSNGSGWGAGDVHYGRLAGDDWLVDVAVGRLSAENVTDAQIVVSKCLHYEQSPYLEETDWYLRGMVNCSDDHPGQSKIWTLRYWRHAMLALGYTQVDTSWHQYNVPSVTAINNGVSVYSHRGYIGTGIQVNQINSLTNDHKLPMVVDLTCATGNWSQSFGLNEAWLRAGSVNTPRGGIGAIGMATSGNMTSFNNLVSGGAADALLVHRTPEMGLLWLGAQVNIWMNTHQSQGGYPQNGIYHQQWCNLMGDPTLWLYTSIPGELDVAAPSEVELGQHSLEVLVTNDSGESVRDAWVTFAKDDENETIYQTEITGPDGMATIPLNYAHTGAAMLTVVASRSLVEIELHRSGC